MAYNKIIYKGDVLMDITDSTVTPETLSEGVIAYGANGERIVGENAGGGDANLKELTVTANGEYEASVYGALEVVTEVYNSTVSYTIGVGDVGFWKSNASFPTDFEAFKSNSSLSIGDSNGLLEEFALGDFEWNGELGVFMACNFIYVIEDPVQFETMMGVQLGFEQGVYIMDQDVTAQGCELTFTYSSRVPCGGYNKVTVDVLDGGLNWNKLGSGVQYATLNGDFIVAANESISDEAFLGATDTEQRLFIVNGVTSIGCKAFQACRSLINISIPNSVTKIDAFAFKYCSGLTSIVIPDSVTEIGGSTFYGCTNLTSIVIPDSVTEISDYMFGDCTNLINITIPDSVTFIDEYAFKNCTSLTHITIPISVTKIDAGAFSGCTTLNDVAYSGTIEQWNAVTKGNNWNTNVPATYVQCSDGQVAL